MKVAILPTGRMEWGGLPSALQKLFPSHEFYPVPTPAEIESNPDHFPYDGFTSVLLNAQHEAEPPEAASELVRRAAQEALGDRRQAAADMVVMLDDLELANIEQPRTVTRVIRSAANLHLAELRHQGKVRARTEEALRERVSFHLIVPMIEAWIFADRTALTTAGVPVDATVIVNPDLEQFYTTDTAYLAATEAACPRLASRRSTKQRPKWLGASAREQHPKGYLQWLCLDGAAKNCTRYNESSSGRDALSDLAWRDVLARPGSPFGYLRAFLDDVADALGESPAITIGEDPGSMLPCTRLSARPKGHVLRNL